MSRSKRRHIKIKSKKRLIIAIIIFIVALTAIITAVNISNTLGYDKIYEGVYIGDTHVGGMSKKELEGRIPALADFSENFDITISVEGVSKTINTAELTPVVDVERMVDSAYEYGRKQSGLSRLGEISDLKKNPQKVEFILAINDTVLQDLLKEISADLDITAVENKIEIGTNSLTITRGTPGRGFLYDEVKRDLTNCLLNHQSTLNITLKDIVPEEITPEYISRNTLHTPVDATYRIYNHRIVFTESHPGVMFDEKKVEEAVKKAKGAQVVHIPVVVLQPNVTTEQLKNSIVNHPLGSFSSDFSSSSEDRAHNIRLASEKIDGYVLEPGEEFSYNEVVGPRTEERGFRMANVYVGNTTQPGIGGGICQVSSTMFNAVVYADLEITQRRNHTLPVSYVPMGRDATVSYDSIDFKFKNNYQNPILISVKAENRNSIVTIYGTNERPNRTVEIKTQKTGTTEPKLVQKESAELEEGKVKVESAGTSGSSYVAYKIVYENGVEVSNEILCKSNYAGKDRVEIIGTKKKEPEESPSPSPSPSVSPKASPSPSVKPSKSPAATAKPSQSAKPTKSAKPADAVPNNPAA